LINEIALLGGKEVIISTNLALRQDGLPYATRTEPEDSAVAVYFTYRDTQRCFACDKWSRVKDNIQAARKTIGALRGIARWGTGDMMERAFDGFTAALPSPENAGGEAWYAILGVAADATEAAVKLAYRRAAAKAHPDRGGDSIEFDNVQRAWAQAQARAQAWDGG
jgi:hypothetical protein